MPAAIVHEARDRSKRNFQIEMEIPKVQCVADLGFRHLPRDVEGHVQVHIEDLGIGGEVPFLNLFGTSWIYWKPRTCLFGLVKICFVEDRFSLELHILLLHLLVDVRYP